MDGMASSEELARLAQGGSLPAFEELVTRHEAALFNFLWVRTGNAAEAEELAQEAFLRAWQRLGQFRADAAFSTWLHAIAVSVALNGLRKVDRHRRRERALEDAEPVAAARRGLDLGARERLAGAVDGLPEIYRTVLVMHDLEGYGHGEIGAILGVPEGTSKARLSRAREKLRATLGDAMKEYVG